MRRKVKRCKVCKAQFVSKRADAIYCSGTCRKAASRTRVRTRRAVPLELPTRKTCAYCGDSFKTDNTARLYCSPSCRTLHCRHNGPRPGVEAVAGQSRKSPGYVYVIQSPTGYYKIGRARDPNKRLHTFEVKLPFEVAYVCLIATDDMIALEGALHRRFARTRAAGEWFSLSPDDVEYLKSLAPDDQQERAG